jgi:hypothetical protein
MHGGDDVAYAGHTKTLLGSQVLLLQAPLSALGAYLTHASTLSRCSRPYNGESLSTHWMSHRSQYVASMKSEKCDMTFRTFSIKRQLVGSSP